MNSGTTLLLVDDDRQLAESMADWLREIGYEVLCTPSIEPAKRFLAKKSPQLLLTDLRLGGEDGMELVRYCAKKCPKTIPLVITGYATPETAVEAVRAGAFDVLTKPLIDEELRLALERALGRRKIEEENQQLRAQLDRRLGIENVLSHDYRMLRIFDMIESVADARASVLITGENGTGKSMIARAIHHRSSRANKPFVEVACGALPDALLESELFGHVAGAFTGANHDRIGKFKLADTGTLFLDEIGTATAALQVKLLRVLQEFQFEPLGGMKTENVDVRVILATNEHLEHAVAEGRFRQDLFYRINVIHIELPSLRERAADIPVLVRHFLGRACQDAKREVEGFDDEAIAVMQRYRWPGNVRELENVVQRAVLLSRASVLGVRDLPPNLVNPPPIVERASIPQRSLANIAPPEESRETVVSKPGLRSAMAAPERQIILQTLRQFNGNRAATASALGINRTTLYKKMKRLGLDDPRVLYAAI
jgi:DNA-binding NtrC family response regulator